ELRRNQAINDRTYVRRLSSPARHCALDGTDQRRLRNHAGAGLSSSSSRRRGVGRTVVKPSASTSAIRVTPPPHCNPVTQALGCASARRRVKAAPVGLTGPLAVSTPADSLSDAPSSDFAVAAWRWRASL